MPSPASTFYGIDLAQIHDSGYGHTAAQAAAVVLAQLPPPKLPGLVVDLGCGSGILAERLTRAGYRVLGIDISPAMVTLARQRAPAAEFRVASILEAEVPPCLAVTAIGEVLNYAIDAPRSPAALGPLFRRVARALVPGGLFLFDVAMPGRIPQGRATHSRVADDWACIADADEDPQCHLLTRRITSFRRVGKTYRRDFEIHRQQLLTRAQVLGPLRACGFRVRVLRRYGSVEFPAGLAAFLCRKPAKSRRRGAMQQ